MERIAYDNNQQVPSWSLMACNGGTTFMNIEIGSVSWVQALSFDDQRDRASIADVGEFRNLTIKPDDFHGIIFNISSRMDAT
jgi:hypothetical protein